MAAPNDGVFHLDLVHGPRRERRRGDDMVDAMAYAMAPYRNVMGVNNGIVDLPEPEPPHTRVKRHFRNFLGQDMIDVEIKLPVPVEHITFDFEVNADGLKPQVVNA